MSLKLCPHKTRVKAIDISHNFQSRSLTIDCSRTKVYNWRHVCCLVIFCIITLEGGLIIHYRLKLHKDFCASIGLWFGVRYCGFLVHFVNWWCFILVVGHFFIIFQLWQGVGYVVLLIFHQNSHYHHLISSSFYLLFIGVPLHFIGALTSPKTLQLLHRWVILLSYLCTRFTIQHFNHCSKFHMLS